MTRYNFVCIYAANGTPLIARMGDLKYELFKPGTGISIYHINKNIEVISGVLNKIIANGTLVTTCFKDTINAFNIPIVPERLNVYDVVCDNHIDIDDLYNRVSSSNVCEWQRVLANAEVVYEDLERRGIKHGYLDVYPRWSLDTYSGRSKTLGFNIQGSTAEDFIINPCAGRDSVFLQMDWIAADIHIAAILSGDEQLLEMCKQGDPYIAISNILSKPGDELSRNECKKALLSAINSMDDSAGIMRLFPKLRGWIMKCRQELDNGHGLRSILGREFVLSESRNYFSVFNATMQGSIAHLMQSCIRKIWELIGTKLLVEIHDSIIVTLNTDEIVALKDKFIDIMCYPLRDLLGIDHKFNIRFSIGTKWQQWKLWQIV